MSLTSNGTIQKFTFLLWPYIQKREVLKGHGLSLFIPYTWRVSTEAGLVRKLVVARRSRIGRLDGSGKFLFWTTAFYTSTNVLFGQDCVFGTTPGDPELQPWTLGLIQLWKCEFSDKPVCQELWARTMREISNSSCCKNFTVGPG